MSFRKSMPNEKRPRTNVKLSSSQSMHKPANIFERFFNRNPNDKTMLENHINIDYKRKFICDLEVELIYTGSLLRQRLDELNHHNLVLQMNECSRLIGKRLSESQKFIESLQLDTIQFDQIQGLLDNIRLSHRLFEEWISSLNSDESVDQDSGKETFSQLELASKAFISRVRDDCAGVSDNMKRNSIDNGSLRPSRTRPEPSYKSRFSEEDRNFVEKLTRMKQESDEAPPKPPLLDLNKELLNEYLTEIEAIVKADQEPVYQYSEITNGDHHNRNSVMVGNNSLEAMPVIPSADGKANGSIGQSSTVSNLNPQSVENRSRSHHSVEQDQDSQINFRRSLPERDKNLPLPAVPSLVKFSTKFKTSQVPTSFHSEEHYYRKTSLPSKERSKVPDSAITNVSHRSPLRSPSLVSCLNLQTNRSPGIQSPSSLINPFSECYIKLSQNYKEECDSQISKTSEHRLMAKEIPSVVSDPNQLLSIRDMQDDIGIVSSSFNGTDLEGKREDFKRLSNCSADSECSPSLNPTEKKSNSLPLVETSKADDTSYKSEVKSDTEEYFEYFKINGVNYRRKMKKRTVIEKIKIQKTVFAPLKSDGSGPDFEKSAGDDQVMNDVETNDCCGIKSESDQRNVTKPEKKIFRRSTEDRFRVSRSMFLPYRENMKVLTINYNNDDKNEQINKTPALLTNYMYRIGKSDFEEPVIDKRMSTQLLDDVNSTWMKTSECNLPHEKSRSICYFKKMRQRNEHGNTVQSACRITASRTVRMKPQDDIEQQRIESQSQNDKPPVTNRAEKYIDDNEDWNVSIADSISSDLSVFESFLSSTDDEKEVGSPLSQNSLSADKETLSTTSTMDDSDYHDSLIEDPPDSVPFISTRSPSLDPCYYPCDNNSFLSETKDKYSFILLENDATPFLIFDKDTTTGECNIAGGPVDALIIYACDVEDNLLFVGAFLDTYRSFIEPQDLINRLIIRYKFFRSKQSTEYKEFSAKREDSGYTDSNEDILRQRRKTIDPDDPEKKCIHILSLLLTIIGTLKRHLNDHINSLILTFEKYLREIHEEQWIHAINNTIKTQRQAMEKDNEMVHILNQMSLRPQSLIDSKSPSKEKNSPTKNVSYCLSNKVSILEFSSCEIAEQMTLLDWGKYRDVELIEILNLKDIANCKLTGVIEYANHFENVQYWTQSILLDPDKKTTSERDRYCLKFLRIMKHLRKLSNFSSLIAILLGIQLLPIERLFSKRIKSKIMEMDDYMKPPKFIGYKDDLKQAMAPCIPFLGIFYQDIVMLNIANPHYLDVDEIDYAGRFSAWSANNNHDLSSNIEHSGPIINFWRSFKQYLFLKNCNKDQDKIRYSIRPKEKILQFFDNFRERYDECTIQKLMKQV